MNAATGYDPGDLVAVAGPTAAGKSEVALQLAELLKGEIISVDSMQVYRGMDIGTAKPSARDRECVPHHLIDVVDVKAEFNAAQFAKLAQEAIQHIRARDRVAVLCGGTGLYFKALFHGLGQAPPGDAAVRAALEKIPPAELLAELAAQDPAAYDRIDKHNPRRIIRAVEVIRVTGRRYSEQRADWTQSAVENQPTIFALMRKPADLRNRINSRVDWMFRNGLVAETEQLLSQGLAQNPTALQALGYRQVMEHLKGIRSLDETIDLVKTRTGQFAKRQLTWFRRQLPVHWIETGPSDSVSKTVLEIAKHLPEALRLRL